MDAKTDISILKENLQKAGKAIRRRSSENESSNKNSLDNKRESREILIAKMEEIQLKHNSLKHDLQRLLDEKEDIVREKEEMNLKVSCFGIKCGLMPPIQLTNQTIQR